MSVASFQSIYDLKERIYDNGDKSFIRCNAEDLILTKVHYIRFRPNADNRTGKVSDVWPGQLHGKHLHVFVSLPVDECIILFLKLSLDGFWISCRKNTKIAKLMRPLTSTVEFQ